MAMAEVTIMGAGILGLSVAWACVRRGARVRVIDPNGVASGASGGPVGALAPHVPENWKVKTAFQFESLLLAETFWADVEAVSGMASGYARLGRVQPVSDDKTLALARERAENAKELWQGKAEWRVERAEVYGDWCPHSPTGWVVFDSLTARIHPKHACLALAAALVAQGCEIVREGAPEGRVVWATGVADLEEISAALGHELGNGVKGQAALLRLDRRGAPQLFADFVHVVPHGDGTVAVGSTSERYFEDGSGTDALLEDLVARARASVPALAGAEVIARWAGVRPRSLSRAPVMGAHPIRAGAFIANGAFKIGFGVAPKLGEVMADLVLEGHDGVPEEFRPEASFK